MANSNPSRNGRTSTRPPGRRGDVREPRCRVRDGVRVRVRVRVTLTLTLTLTLPLPLPLSLPLPLPLPLPLTLTLSLTLTLTCRVRDELNAAQAVDEGAEHLAQAETEAQRVEQARGARGDEEYEVVEAQGRLGLR